MEVFKQYRIHDIEYVCCQSDVRSCQVMAFSLPRQTRPIDLVTGFCQQLVRFFEGPAAAPRAVDNHECFFLLGSCGGCVSHRKDENSQ